jgi:RHS repeat-associated protein
LQLTSTDPLGNQTSTVYDTFSRGLVAQSIEAVGSAVQRSTVPSYDAAGRITATRDALGWVGKTTFDPVGRATGTADALGNKALSAFDRAGQSTASRDQLGFASQSKYNLRGWATSSTDAAGNVTTTQYDAAGNVTAVTDALNHTTTYLYDALGRSTGQIDPLNHRTTTAYDADSNVSTVTDANGNVTSYAYDALDRQTMTTEAVGSAAQRTSTVAYDAVVNVTSSTDFLGHRVTTAYDALNRATVVTDPLGHSVTTAYDKAGNVTTVTDALSKITSYAYDALNRLLATTDPLGHVATQVDDANGQAVASVDPLGDFARTVFNQVGEAIGSLDLRGGYTQTGFDGAGGTTAVTDSVGNTTGYVNDSLGRQSVATDPTGAKTTTTYDAAGHVSTITDRDGRQQVFHYDSANRLTAETWLSSAGVTVNLLTYTYDSNNNQLTAADYNGTITSSYDALNRLTAQTDVFGLALTYQYDAADRLTQQSDSAGGMLTYVYDNSDRITSERLTGSSSAARVDLGYDNRNELTSLTRFTDVAGSNVVGTTVYAYDDAQRLTSIVNKTGAAATLSYYQYTLDNAGRSTQESWQSQNTTGGVISGTHTYAYDATNQLTAADGTVYNWDLNGNSTNAGKQTVSANRLTNDGTYTYTYDAQGNMIEQSKGSGLETWYYGNNTQNQLTSVRETTDGTTNELTITYTYDVLDRRVEEDRWATGGSVTVTRTAFDDGNVAWADLNGSNTVQTRYVAGDGTNQWFARIDGSGVEWLLADRLGSVRDVVATAGTLVGDHTERAAFGAVTSDTSVGAAGRIGWEGMWQDRDANSAISASRVWNTWTMQWDQEDPKQFGGGDGNLRRPVGNDPANAVDPSGMAADLPSPTVQVPEGGVMTKDMNGNEKNGNFNIAGTFVLSQPAADDGFVLQHVLRKFSATPKNSTQEKGLGTSLEADYWEVFPIKKGQSSFSYIKWAPTEHPKETSEAILTKVYQGAFPNVKDVSSISDIFDIVLPEEDINLSIAGKNYMTGEAYYVEGADWKTLPGFASGKVKSAGPFLPSRKGGKETEADLTKYYEAHKKQFSPVSWRIVVSHWDKDHNTTDVKYYPGTLSEDDVKPYMKPTLEK